MSGGREPDDERVGGRGTAAVLKRREQCRLPQVLAAFRDLVDHLEKDPFFVVRDKAAVWRKAFPQIPHHRRADLGDAWRASWAVIREGKTAKGLVVFLGTNKEYETLYGFTRH